MSNKPGRIIRLSKLHREFDEHSLRKFLAKFGTVTNLEISRSSKTGNSRGLAFVEFENVSVVSIASKALDDYVIRGASIAATQLKLGHEFKFRTRPTRSHGKEYYAELVEKVNSTDGVLESRRAHRSDDSLSKTLAAMGLTYSFKRPMIDI